jgi:hypothetical protein
MNPDTRVCRRCIDAVEFRALATGHCFDGLEPAFLGDAAETRRHLPVRLPSMRGWAQGAGGSLLGMLAPVDDKKPEPRPSKPPAPPPSEPLPPAA